MSLFPVRDLARLSFPGRAGSGWFLMLEGYFDDGGTHEGSEVVVWGGVMGDTEWFDNLERAWLLLLAEPLPGKPRIKQFHHSHITNGWKEFSGYNQGERDLVTKRFRDAVIAARLVPVSFCLLSGLAQVHNRSLRKRLRDCGAILILVLRLCGIPHGRHWRRSRSSTV